MVIGAASPVQMVLPVSQGPVLTQDLLGAKAFSPNLKYYRYEGIRTLFEKPQDPFLPDQWYFHNTGQEDSTGSQGVPAADIKLFPALEIYVPRQAITLAVIDSGIDLLHEDIDNEILWVNDGEIGLDDNGNDRSSNGLDDDGNGYVDDIHGWNMVKNIHDIQDRHYHGTHVSGLIGATANNNIGMTGGFNSIKLMFIKIFDLGGTATRPQIAKAIRYACDNGAKIINASWGSGYESDDIRFAIEHCSLKGVLFVGAAGNSRKNMDLDPDYPSAYDINNQIVVSATDNQDRPATFSNFGSMVDIAAPGSYVLSLLPNNRYRSFSGTSQAAPMVAGALALLWSQEPWLTVSEIKQRLIYSADQRYSLKRWVSSASRLNIYNLLANKKGERITASTNLLWQEKPYRLESPHPYRYDMDNTYTIEIPEATHIKLHFERFELSKHNDTLTISTESGNVIEHLNSHLPAFWTEAIPGNKVLVRLLTNNKVNDWGFKINKIKYSVDTSNQ